MTAASEISKITLRSPADLVAATPYLLGFHPDRSLVMVALAGRRVTFAARCDLSGSAPDAAGHLVEVVLRQDATEVVALAYGPADQARPALEAARAAAVAGGLSVRDLLRVDQERWWSYLCEDAACCPPEGTLFDHATSPAAATCVVEGLTALPSRRELLRQVAPLGGLTRTSMIQATERAWSRLERRLSGLPEERCAAAVRQEGAAAVTGAIQRYAAGERLDDDAVAWLTVLLQSIPVRDVAWTAITGEQPHLRLWQDVTRRAEPELVAAPASLLAFTAYRAGNGPLATAALERVLTEDPGYSMAQLLLRALQHGLPPSAFDGWPWQDGALAHGTGGGGPGSAADRAAAKGAAGPAPTATA
jgi:hypothetical protein